jgi:hypothetical protein
MERPFPRFLGEAQLRGDASHPRLACAKQSQRSAQNSVSVGLKGRETRRQDHGSGAPGALCRVRERSQRLCRVEAHRREHHGSGYRVVDAATQQWVGALTALPALRHTASSLLRLEDLEAPWLPAVYEKWPKARICVPFFLRYAGVPTRMDAIS